MAVVYRSKSVSRSSAIRESLPYSLADYKSSIARDSLPDFIRQSWHLIEPSTPLSWNWHLDELCDVLTRASRGEPGYRRIIINLPPGGMKSLTLTLWAAWEWASNPSLSYLTASYTDDNTIRDNRRLRSIVTSDWYRSSFWTARPGTPNQTVSLASDQSAKVRFDTTAKGWRIASSVGGIGTGEHPDRIIVDDPHKAADSRYLSALKSACDWMDGTISTRVMKDPVIVVVMQRLHLSDVSAHLLAKGGWTHVRLPMRYIPYRPKTDKSDEYVPDPRDHRTYDGELLWPERWPEDKVRQEEIDLGPFGASGQLQQTPVPEGGGLIKREWLPIVDAPPTGPHVRRCRGWDTADTPDGGNWTVGVRLSYVQSTGLIYIEHVERAQSGPGGVDSLMLSTARADGTSVLVREGSGSGKATIAARTKSLYGYDYASMPENRASGDKVSRANPFRAQCEAGNVRVVRGSWNEAYLSVLTSFPVGKYDDDVDATANAFNALVQTPVPREVSLTWRRSR